MTLKFSIIIPFKEPSEYLYECLDHIKKQSYTNYEVILLPDQKLNIYSSSDPDVTSGESISLKKKFSKSSNNNRVICTGKVGPAEKRDIGAEKSKGEILAFIDDDAYPDKNWLKEMAKNFADTKVAAVGGPGVTPPDVSWQEQASGWFSASILGGGPYAYRFLPYKRRYVDDYPTMNLTIRKKDFYAAGGFDSTYWPGEDTKLCYDLVYKLGKKIIYDPKVLVYHHRRKLWVPHLVQNGNYGLHRGYFAKALPKTSFRLVYFLPSFLVIGIIILPMITLSIYFTLLFMNGIWIAAKSRSLIQGLISMPVVSITHFWYGVRFIQGFLFTKNLKN